MTSVETGFDAVTENHLTQLTNKGMYEPSTEHDACGVGFVAQMRGEASYAILSMGLQILENLVHRGACGCDPETGDGAGILLQVPDSFFRSVVDFSLPERGSYGVAMVFLPRNADHRAQCERTITSVVRQEGQILLGWRDVPVNSSAIGPQARETEPLIRQCFIGRGSTTPSETFERKLYVIRKQVESLIAGACGIPNPREFYLASLSSQTIVYKGLLLPHQMRAYFIDLADERMETAIALVHQRFSTNTFPSWPLAHPFRYVAHNGEINTINGNRNWMRAREAGMVSSMFGDDMRKISPLVSREGSDSATLDQAVELMVQGGRSLAHSMMLLIPEAWSGNALMDPARRAFYEYGACLVEPWDGPAAVAFTDGKQIGAVLDRNGLRPARYTITTDGLVVLASETGVIEFDTDRIQERGRLQPGKIFLVDTELGRIRSDAEVKAEICSLHPYGAWLDEHRVELGALPTPEMGPQEPHESLRAHQRAFGYTSEDVRMLLTPVAMNGEEPLGSMGTDTPLAVLSHRPQSMFSYFKQLFAQVTNPPIDPIRESLVMDLADYIGTDGSFLEDVPENAHQLKIESPILLNTDLEKLRRFDDVRLKNLRTVTLPAVFDVNKPHGELERAVEWLCRKASDLIEDGVSVIVISDRSVDKDHAPVPSLLSISAVHHHLIREGTRTKAALVLESGEAREVHHFACLLGYGASAINPYLAFDTFADLIQEGDITTLTVDKANNNFIKGINKGLLKVMSKMGISTIPSYRGAQIFEAVGIASSVIEKYFSGTPSRIEGVTLDDIEREVRSLHDSAYPQDGINGDFELDPGGQYQWRRFGESHSINPDSVESLQKAVRNEDTAQGYATFKEFSKAINEAPERASTIRGLLRFVPGTPVAIEEVEPVANIVKRFATGAMSLGSISRESHEGLAIAMNFLKAKSNTGEGGEDPERFTDNRRSSIKQVASGRFGVTTHYLVNADELQIKMAQGAKPGEGGQLPGYKVDDYIGRIRHTTPGVTLVSPPPHHDIYSIEDIAQLIFDLKNVNPSARISVKLVSEVGVGTVAAGVAKAHADHILISGYEGGTGASPLSSIKHAGIPWELGLAETQQVLVANQLRGRVVLQADGQMKTGRDVVVAALLGAEEYGFSTAPLVAQGCIMMRVCHLGTCPVGIATQDPILRKKFAGKPEHVINYFFFVAEEVRQIMAELGFRTVDEMIGRSDRLEASDAVRHWKSRGVDLSRLLLRVAPQGVATRCLETQDHGLEGALDYHLIMLAKPALEHGRPVAMTIPIHNHNRSCGTMLSGEVAKRFGVDGLADSTINIKFYGSAGQSFGAFLAPGMTLELHGDANDYLGKGMSGGRIVVRPEDNARYKAYENVIAGNTLLYGATKGEAFLSGVVGERFAVRNSGATAVVEGVGDHGCEYMTGGTVVVLGTTGRNFGAGMSGGYAYVWDVDGRFEQRLNPNSNLDLTWGLPLEDLELIHSLVVRHVELTNSERGRMILQNWEDEKRRFAKVVSEEYKALLAKRAEMAAKA